MYPRNDCKDVMEKVCKKINDIYDKAIVIVCIMLMLFAFYTLYDAYYVKYVSSGTSFMAYKPTDEEPFNRSLTLSDLVFAFDLSSSDLLKLVVAICKRSKALTRANPASLASSMP